MSGKPRHLRVRKRKRTTSCGKRRYRDHAEAVNALRTILGGTRHRERTPARAYYCAYCKGYHLTSQA